MRKLEILWVEEKPCTGDIFEIITLYSAVWERVEGDVSTYYVMTQIKSY